MRNSIGRDSPPPPVFSSGASPANSGSTPPAPPFEHTEYHHYTGNLDKCTCPVDIPHAAGCADGRWGRSERTRI